MTFKQLDFPMNSTDVFAIPPAIFAEFHRIISKVYLIFKFSPMGILSVCKFALLTIPVLNYSYKSNKTLQNFLNWFVLSSSDWIVVEKLEVWKNLYKAVALIFIDKTEIFYHLIHWVHFQLAVLVNIYTKIEQLYKNMIIVY